MIEALRRGFRTDWFLVDTDFVQVPCETATKVRAQQPPIDPSEHRTRSTLPITTLSAVTETITYAYS